ncbi:MAG: hypothetical protein FJW40_26380 [Acidobacteria bacterium]|nr:hypothetical protein [Acidobacteriota bacterium]
MHQAQRHVLYRLVALADLYDAPWVVACPREEHSMIYQRMFGFKQIAEPRQYFGLNFQTDLPAIPLEEIRQVAARVKPMREAWTEARQGLAVQQAHFGRCGVCAEDGGNWLGHMVGTVLGPALGPAGTPWAG